LVKAKNAPAFPVPLHAVVISDFVFVPNFIFLKKQQFVGIISSFQCHLSPDIFAQPIGSTIRNKIEKRITEHASRILQPAPRKLQTFLSIAASDVSGIIIQNLSSFTKLFREHL